MMRKIVEVRKIVKAWKENTCPYIEKCKKERKFNKKHDGFILKDCPQRCFEDDLDYLENISCILE